MPHAEKELNPLWGLLNEPLFQIIAAVGLLLTGVLGILGRLVSDMKHIRHEYLSCGTSGHNNVRSFADTAQLGGLGLGGLLDGILGNLGLTKVLEGLGLGKVTGALTGKKDGGKKGGKLLGIL